MNEKLPDRIHNKFGYLEKTPELFETKILRLNFNPETSKRLLVVSRDPGAGNAIIPVVKELSKDSDLGVDALVDGFAQQKFETEFGTDDISPEGSILESDVTLDPKAMLICRSSDMGIEMYSAATFPEVPRVLLEDYYTSSINYLSELQERNLPFPKKICVGSDNAKKAIVQAFPDLESIVEVTGEPALDRFVDEPTENIASEVRGKLGLTEQDKLVSFMSTIDGLQKVGLISKALKEIKKDYHFAFRRHPRDNVSYEEYEKLFVEEGVNIINTQDYSTDEINIASDVIMTTWSTEGMNGIYRGKSTIHLIDSNFPIPEDLSLPLPPVQDGASVGVYKIADVKHVLLQLLDTKSKLSLSIHQKMEEKYHLDGKNSERVANIVRGYL